MAKEKKTLSKNDFSNLDVTIPIKKNELNFLNTELYNYDFNQFYLAPIKEAADQLLAEKIQNNVFSAITLADMVDKKIDKKIEYVAKIPKNIQEKIDKGELSILMKKNGAHTASVFDNKTKKIYAQLELESKSVSQDLGSLPQLYGMQDQLANLAEKIEDLTKMIERVEQGQYNDRYAGYFSARQQLIEAMTVKDETLKLNLMTSAIKTANDIIAKLMLTIHQDVNDFANMKVKPKDAKRIEVFLKNSFGYLSSTVQLNLSAYTAIGEETPLLSTLTNYQSFIKQTLLSSVDGEKTLAWKLDNAHKGEDGNINQISIDINTKIDSILKERFPELEDKKVEKIEG